MALRDILPTPWTRERIPVRRERENPFYALQREMNRMFDRFFSDFSLSPYEDRITSYWPSVDVSESEKEIKVTAELPGMEHKDIDISIANDVLTLRGEKKIEKEEKEENYYRKERSYGAFHRDVPLPAEVETENVEAIFKNGILTIRLPKKPEAQRKSKRISIKAA